MATPRSKANQFHLPRYLVAGGFALVLLGWAWSSFGLVSSPNKAARAPAPARNLQADFTAQEKSNANSEDRSNDTHEGVSKSSPQVTSGVVGDSLNNLPGSSSVNDITSDGAPSTSLLSNGSSLEDQLQALRSAELHESNPVEPSPSGVPTAPPAPPGAVNPHQ